MFKFKLQLVLDHRKLLEDLAQNEYAKAKRGLLEIKRVVEGMEKNLKRSKAEYRKIGKTEPNSETFKLFDDYIKRVKFEISQQRRVIEEKQEVVNTKHHDLMEAVKKKRVIEALRERKRIEYNREMTARDLKLMDEISVIRFERLTNES